MYMKKHLLYLKTITNMKSYRALIEKRWRKYHKQLSEKQLQML